MEYVWGTDVDDIDYSMVPSTSRDCKTRRLQQAGKSTAVYPVFENTANDNKVVLSNIQALQSAVHNLSGMMYNSIIHYIDTVYKLTVKICNLSVEVSTIKQIVESLQTDKIEAMENDIRKLPLIVSTKEEFLSLDKLLNEDDDLKDRFVSYLFLNWKLMLFNIEQH